MTTHPSLTLSVVSHGHGDMLVRLLTDLDAVPMLHGAQVIVTLNLADERFDETRFARLKIQVLRNASPRGFGANHNQAFAHSTTPWFAILNPDLRIPIDFFPALIDSVEQFPAAALFAPRVANSSGQLEDSVRVNLSPWQLLKRMLQKAMRRPTTTQIDGAHFHWFAGMFLLVRASAFAAVNGFDERYFLYCEDYDLCARMHLAGSPLHYVPQATVIHDAQRDSHRSARHLKLHLASMLRVWLAMPMWKIALENVGFRRRRPSSGPSRVR